MIEVKSNNLFKAFMITQTIMNKFLFAVVVIVTFYSKSVLAAESNVIVLFGDSITVGENNAFPSNLRPGSGVGRQANDGGFPTLVPTNLLDDLLVQQRRTSVVINWGIGGSSTGGQATSGANRVLSNLSSTRNAFAADNYYVLILYGTNDFNVSLAPSDTQFNLQLIIDRARSLGFIPVIGTLTPRDDRNISSYNSAVVAAANSRNVPIVDHFSRFVQDGNGGFDLLDLEFFGNRTIRLHPSAEGYSVIAQTWFDQYLVNVLEANPVIISPIINLLLDE